MPNDRDPPPPNDNAVRTISGGRKFAYYLGTVLIVGGFATCFLALASTAFIEVRQVGNGPPTVFRWFLGGMAAVPLGALLSRWGRAGAAGSGLVLDPERARRDLEPWNRAAGGMLSDTLKEVGPLRELNDHLRTLADRTTSSRPAPGAPAAEVKVRCRACRALADETARFCPQCGQPM